MEMCNERLNANINVKEYLKQYRCRQMKWVRKKKNNNNQTILILRH